MSAFGLTTIPPSGTGSGSNKTNIGLNQSQKQNNKNFTKKNRFQNNRSHQNDNPKRDRPKKLPQTRQVSAKNHHNPLQKPVPTPPVDQVDPEYVVQTKILPSKVSVLPPPTQVHDQFIGPLFKNPERLGYVKLPPKQQPLPNYLVHEHKFLEKHDFKPDDWDILNQKKMLQLSHQVQDTNELMELLEPMRDAERLEMENRGLVDRANVSKSLADAIIFRGSCLYMCPIFEKVKRVINGDISKYEKVNNQITDNSVIKLFSRSEAGQAPQLPSDVRPPHVLVQTLDYMIDNLLDKLPECEPFIWNRTRSIRQDFTYQNYFGPELVYCIEKICRIHILTLHIMAGSDVEYSQQQELEQLNKSLETLNEIYDDLNKLGKHSPNESEFRSYYLISYYSKPELDQMIQHLPPLIYHSHSMQLAITFRGLMLQNNTKDHDNLPGGWNLFTKFFQACFDTETPFLMSCLLEIHFNEIRFYALKSMSIAYHSGGKPYYASQLADMLGFDHTEELVNFISYYDLNTVQENDQLCIYLSPFKFNFVKDKEKLKQSYSRRLNEKINGLSYKDIIQMDISIRSNPQAKLPQAPLPKSILPKLIPQSALPKSQSALPQPVKEQPKVIPVFKPAQPIQPVQIKPQPLQVQPQPIQPPPKSKISELPNFQPAIEQIYKQILQQNVHDSLKQIIPTVITKEQQDRERQNLISSLSVELYNAFMNEIIHVTIDESRAESIRDLNLRKKLIKLIKPIAVRCLESKKLKKRKLQELEEFKNQRVVDQRVDERMLEVLKRQKLNRNVSTSMKIPYNDLWDPIDLRLDFIHRLKISNTNLKILVIVKDWNLVSAKWLIRKLQLRPNKAKTTFILNFNDKINLKITGLPDQFQESRYFHNSSFIIIEIGKPQQDDSITMQKKLRFDSKVLFKILEYIEKNCLYQVSMMILYYNSNEKIPMGQVNEILRIDQLKKSNHIQRVELHDMNHDASQILLNGLHHMADNFELVRVSDAEDVTELDTTNVTTTTTTRPTSPIQRNQNRLNFLKKTLNKRSTSINLQTTHSIINNSFGISKIDDISLTNFNNNIYQIPDMTILTKRNLSTSTPITKPNSIHKKSKALELRELAAKILNKK